MAFVAMLGLARYYSMSSVGRDVHMAIWKTEGTTGFPLLLIVATMVACQAIGAVATVGLSGAFFANENPTAALALCGGSIVRTSLPCH